MSAEEGGAGSALHAQLRCMRARLTCVAYAKAWLCVGSSCGFVHGLLPCNAPPHRPRPPPRPPPPPLQFEEPGGGCFPAAATANVRGRGAVPMAQLAVGDEVLAMDGKTGSLAYKPVYLFGHQDSTTAALFVNIEAAPLGADSSRCGNSTAGSTGSSSSSSSNGRCRAGTTVRLQLSQQHFLPVCSRRGGGGCATPRLPGLPAILWAALMGGSSSSIEATWQLRYVRDVQPGMLVLVASNSSSSGSSTTAGSCLEGSPSSTASLAVVTRVWITRERGLFNPFVHVSLALSMGLGSVTEHSRQGLSCRTASAVFPDYGHTFLPTPCFRAAP